MNWDVKHGAETYKKSHPMVETGMLQGKINVLNEGEDFYHSLFNDIQSAEKSIWIHFFITRDDNISNQFFNLLKQRARDGLDVRLSVDFLGSDISSESMNDMKKSGVHIVKSRPISLKNVFYSLHHRNHRRLISIDGSISYIGGFNMGDEYLGKDPKLGYWRDYHLRIEGEDGRELANQFKKDWDEDGGERLNPISKSYHSIKENQSSYYYIFSTGDGIVDKTVEWINGAKSSITITTPYFIPNTSLVDALKKAVKRGVEINIIVPDDTDAWFTKPPSYRIEKKLLKSGVNMYLYQKGFFHGKVIIIDHKWADVGTANWDPRSFYLNDESNCIIEDREVVKELEKLLEGDIEESKKLTLKEFKKLPSWEKWLRKTPQWVYYYF